MVKKAIQTSCFSNYFSLEIFRIFTSCQTKNIVENRVSKMSTRGGHHGGGGSSGASYQPLATKDIEMGPTTASSSTKTDTSTTTTTTSTPATPPTPPALTARELFRVLSPYFWPSGSSPNAITNRIRSTSTWLMVILSKVCNLVAPFYLATATNDIVNRDYIPAVHAMLIYTLLRFLSSFFKEMQSILYIAVKQQAGIELQTFTFAHLHSLSLNWHLSKKTGKS